MSHWIVILDKYLPMAIVSVFPVAIAAMWRKLNSKGKLLGLLMSVAYLAVDSVQEAGGVIAAAA